ncbi:MAG: hypothetical protein EOO60_13055 [Hymenobacter sp.]|nr:MAG: hypothetical protein EOO60_13055 [Hymenobacter sp.]
MSSDKKGKSLLATLFGKGNTPPGGTPIPSVNYGNHVGSNHGTVTQIGGGSSSSSTKSGMVFDEVSTITVNGREFTGRKIEQQDGRILVDGRDVTDEVGAPARELLIVVQGDVSKLEVHGGQRVTVNGNAGSVTTTTGPIEVKGDVTGSVESVSGSITCGKVSGSVKTVTGSIYPR